MGRPDGCRSPSVGSFDTTHFRLDVQVKLSTRPVAIPCLAENVPTVAVLGPGRCACVARSYDTRILNLGLILANGLNGGSTKV